MPRITEALRQLARPLWVVGGFVALAIGALGAVLPILPTTPLVLLAAFCFARSSPRFARMLEEHVVFGPIIADWRQNGAIATRYKVTALVMMGAALGLSVWAGFSGRVIAIQAVCIVGAATYILSRPSKGPGPGKADLNPD